MPAWLSRVAVPAIASIAVGLVASTCTAWWCLSRVEQGVAPETGRIHVREGRFWWIATDRALGLEWVNVERVQEPSRNLDLALPGIPGWAEPRGRGPLGEWRVGTLAVGWPYRMIARQWSETEPDRLFVPHAEIDDDGFTIAKMATNFLRSSTDGRYTILTPGFAANVMMFGGAMFLILLPRVFSRRGDAAERLG